MAFTYGGANPYYSNFMQPNGTIYFIQSNAELPNVPINLGTVAAICLPENTMYLKSMQNGVPSYMTYKLQEVQKQNITPTPAPAPDASIENRFKSIEEQLQKIVEQLQPTPPGVWET